jgi:hypothetical protein
MHRLLKQRLIGNDVPGFAAMPRAAASKRSQAGWQNGPFGD